MMIGERDVIDARREELEAEFFAGSNDERFSALDPAFEAACDDAAQDVELPSWVEFNVSPDLSHLVIQPTPCLCQLCVPF